MSPPPKKPAAPPPPAAEPPPPPKPADQLEKGVKRATMDKMGSKVGPPPTALDKTFEVRAAPAEIADNHGVKDAERLKHVLSPTLAQAERQWLEKLQAKLQIGAPIAAKKLGFGLWKKKYETKQAFAEALDKTIGPVFAKAWAFEQPVFTATDDEAIFIATLPEITGEPPLHPSYAGDTRAYALNIYQDDIRHVAHVYVMAFAHYWFRALIAVKRTSGADTAAQVSGLSKEQLFALETNFCTYYVPSTLPAYFEGQPLRAFAREIANRFRKVAFGGQ